MQTNWDDVWNLGLKVFAQQRIEMQILIGLAAAFLAVMVLEGLRASFFPKRRAAASPATAEPEERVVFIPQPPPQAMTPTITQPQPFAARRASAVAPNIKRKAADVRKHKPTRPIIRRMANGGALTGHDQEMTA